MPTRQGDAEWTGDLRSGQGTLRFAKYEGPYTYTSRFEDGQGTNPEELIAGAHAGCFSMAFAGDLAQAGYTPERVQTTAHVTVEMVGGGHQITGIKLVCRARVPGIDEATFMQIAQQSKTGCPVSRALAAVPIDLDAKLE